MSFGSKKSDNSTQVTNTSTTMYDDRSANAGGDGSLAVGTGATVSIDVQDLSEGVAREALTSNQAVARDALGYTAQTASNALGYMSQTAADALGANTAVSRDAIGYNSAVAGAALDTVDRTAGRAIDAGLKQTEFTVNTIAGLAEVAARENADTRNFADLAVRSTQGLTSQLQELTSQALERAQTPDSAAVSKILKPIVIVVGVVLVAFAIFRGKK